MIDNLKYYIFGALAIAAAIAITGNNAKADLLNFSLPQIEMIKTDSYKKVSSTTAGLIGTYIVMRQMAKSDHEKEELERKDAEAQKKVQDDKRRCHLLTTVPTADLELKIQSLMKLKL